MFSTLDTSQVEMSTLNTVADMKMAVISVTLDTSHFEMSALNHSVFLKMSLISVILDTSHSSIDPSGPSEQLPCEDISKHASTAFWSCDFDSGKNSFVSHTFNERNSLDAIDPGESSNMRSLLASEFTQAAPQSC